MTNLNFVKLALLLAVAIDLSMDATFAHEPLQFLDSCEETRACLNMTIDSLENLPTHDYHRPTEFVPRISRLLAPLWDIQAEFTDYELALQGRLDGGPLQEHRIVFRAYTDGLWCSTFGQGSVPVVGFTPDGHRGPRRS